MEKLYRKLPNGKYESAGYTTPDIYPGLYFCQDVANGKRKTSVNYWLGGDFKEPVHLEKLFSIMSLDCDLASYLIRLTEKDSKETEQAKKDHNIKEHINFHNISAQDLSILVLRFLYNQSQKSENDVDSPF